MDTSPTLNEMQNLDLMVVMHQKNELFQLLEELRFSRSSNKNMEAKLASLSLSKFKLESEFNSLLTKHQKLTNCCQDLEKKLSCNSNSSSENDCNSETKKLFMALEAAETTIGRLKKNIMTYKVTISDLEKKLSDNEQKNLIAQQSSSLLCEKVEQIHKIADKISNRLEQVTTSQMRLEKNIEAATVINAEHAYMQQNLQQTIITHVKEKKELKLQVLKLSSRLRLKSLDSGIIANESFASEEIKCLLDENKTLQEINLSLNADLSKNKKQLQEANASLKRLHDMLKGNMDWHEQAQLKISAQLNEVISEKS